MGDPIKEYPKFNLSPFKMGYFIQYAKIKGDKFGKQIEQEQLKRGYDAEDAQMVHCEVSGGGKYSTNIRPPKTTLVEFPKVHKGRFCRVTKFKMYDHDPSDRVRLKVAYFSATLCNLSYDWMGVLKFKMPWVFHSKRRYFCAEGCAWALSMAYLKVPDVHVGAPHLWMPADFSSDRFETVWEGEIPK